MIFWICPACYGKNSISMEVAGNLAFIGSIKDDVLDIEALGSGAAGVKCRRIVSGAFGGALPPDRGGCWGRTPTTCSRLWAASGAC